MTLTHQTPLRKVRLRALLALLAVLFSALTAASAAADTSTAPAAAGPAAPVAADPSAASPAVASTSTAGPAPGATPAGSGGAAAATPTGQTSITEAATTTPVPPIGDDIQAQPAIIAVGSANAPLEQPTHYPNPPAPPSSGASPSSGQHPNLEQPIVGSTGPRVVAYRPEVTQLASGGPLVTSGVPSPAAHATRPAAHRAASINSLLLYALGPVAPRVAPAVDVSVSQLDLYVTTATSARHPGQKSSPFAPPVSPAGVPASTISPFGPGAPDQPGGAAGLFGNAPFSSGGSATPLLGLNALLAAVTLLGAMAWRRRSWDLPVFPGESALLSTALDRPG